MAEKKKQHYVPKFIIRQFTDANKQIAIFNVEKNFVIDKKVPFDSHCYTKYFYGKDLKWENKLKRMEDLCSPIVHNIVEDKTISISDQNSIKVFCLFQCFRTEGAVDKIESMSEKAYDQIILDVCGFYGEEVDEQEVYQFGNNQLKKISRTETVLSNLEMANEMRSYLSTLDLVILNNHTFIDFVCSDNPIILENMFQHDYGIGINSVGLIMLFPISSRKALMIIDKKVYNKIETSVELTVEDVRNINAAIYDASREILFSKEISSLIEIKEFWDNRPTFPKLKLSFLQLKEAFSPYSNDVSRCFFRDDTIETLEFKFMCWDSEYSKLVKEYIGNEI